VNYVMAELSKTHDPRAVEVLVGILQDDTANKELKSKAAKALGELGDPSAIPALRAARPGLGLQGCITWLLLLPLAREWPPRNYLQVAFDEAIKKLEASHNRVQHS
jgi:hypothetical protein